MDPFAGMSDLGSIGGKGGGASKVGGAGAVDDVKGANSAGGFASMLANKLTELNSQQASASNEMNAVATGKVDDVAQSMVRIEQANVSLQMATQVRNKVIEAYQEVIRMQI
jgi:flagellar hook-basal body complex protein FliE